jgi:hypothetical protein
MSLKKITEKKKRGELYWEQSFLLKCVTILAACNSGFFFWILVKHHLPTKLACQTANVGLSPGVLSIFSQSQADCESELNQSE